MRELNINQMNAVSGAGLLGLGIAATGTVAGGALGSIVGSAIGGIIGAVTLFPIPNSILLGSIGAVIGTAIGAAIGGVSGLLLG